MGRGSLQTDKDIEDCTYNYFKDMVQCLNTLASGHQKKPQSLSKHRVLFENDHCLLKMACHMMVIY